MANDQHLEVGVGLPGQSCKHLCKGMLALALGAHNDAEERSFSVAAWLQEALPLGRGGRGANTDELVDRSMRIGLAPQGGELGPQLRSAGQCRMAARKVLVAL